MSRKGILIICLIICTILSLQAVAAVDVGGDSTDASKVQNVTNVLTYSLPNSQELLQAGSDGTFSDLQDDINAAGATLTLERNYTWDTTIDKNNPNIKKGVYINKNIKITGYGVTIDAKEANRIFNITDGSRVTLEGITFVNGNFAGNGGSIYGGTLTIYNCTFINNKVTNGDGGAIFTNRNSTLFGTTFINNTASTRAGAARLIFISNISDCKFINSTGSTSGGAVYFNKVNYQQPSISIYNTEFINNGITGSSYGGGAINVASDFSIEIISNCTFIDNYASKEGGAIKTEGTVYVVDSRFINNTATKGAAIYGAGSRKEDTNPILTVVNSNFTGNRATDTNGDGGAIWSGTTNITDCIFTDNYAKHYGGAIYVTNTGKATHGKNISITNTLFDNNSAVTGGGAIYSIATMTINNTNLTNNKVTSGGGGAISSTAVITIDDSNFTGNNATTTGGAILTTADTTIYSSTFNNNHVLNSGSTNGGGAIYINNNTATLTIYDSSFDDNEAKGVGGAIRSTITTINNCNFTNNGVTGDAGAIYIVGSDSEVSDSTFNGNDATGNGGAVYWRGANGILNGSNFTYNNATGNGGAVYWSGSSGSISRSKFSKSRATNGAAVYVYGLSNSISYSNFTDNIATGNGGGVHSLSNYSEILYSIFNDNVASGNGGGIYARGLATRIICNFTGNNATNGGGLYTGSGESNPERQNPPHITYSNFTSNHATVEGGGMFSGFISSQMYNCTFINNNADKGGALSMVCENELLADSIFINNTASTKGGSVYVQKISDSEILDTTFINSSALDGGAIYNKGGGGASLQINNVTFINNTAVYNGGAIYYVVDADKENKTKIYRDYNDFDGEGTNTTDGRTDVNLKNAKGESQGTKISHSLFVNNNDYPINMAVDSYGSMAVVSLTDPKDIDKNSLIIVMNVTNETGLVDNFTINPDNYDQGHWNDDLKSFYNSFDLERDNNYNAIITFYDVNHLAKVINSTFNTTSQKEGAFESLQKSINEALSSGKTSITLKRPYTYDRIDIMNKTGCINITSSITIDGSGWAINAGGFCRIFNITGANVTLENLVLTNGNASGLHGNNNEYGGAIYWSGVNGTLNNVNITDCYAGENGGGIYFYISAANATVHECTFIDNTAKGNGGAIDCNATKMYLLETTFESNHAVYGAALCREVNATAGYGIYNTFIANNATIGGAALAWIKAKEISITNYTFINNTAGVSGGAIFVDEYSTSCTVINCTFEGNYIYNVNAGHGGAIEWYADKGVVVNSTFTRNSAYDGGAIFANDESEEIIINRSTFSYNYAYSYGGAVSLEASKVTIEGTTFKNNHAVRGGGALYINGTATSNNVSNSVFENNWVTEGNGGGIDWLASAGNISHSNFTNNSAVYGGGIYLSGNSNNSVIEHVIFKGNNATKNGGAIDWNAQNGHLYYNQFIGNEAEYGAALCREAGATGGNGTDNIFTSNKARISGAGLAWMGSDNITIINYNFTYNTAVSSGGAIYVSNISNNCQVIDCNFKENRIFEFNEESLGGAIDWKGSNGTIRNSKFTLNHGYNGGAVFVGSNEGVTNIIDSNFIENSAHENGGAVNINSSSVHLNNTYFKGNTAFSGGAIFVGEKGADNYIYKSVFDSNKAIAEHANDESHGGAINWLSAAGKILYSNFTNNQADYGGAIYLNGKSNNTLMDHLIFKRNNATKNGGAIDWNAENGHLFNCSFISNYAGEYGAALCREAEATGGNGKDNSFEYNHAGNAGAALAWMGSVGITITNYTFNYNTANVAGAAIFVNETSHNCSIIDSRFLGNEILNETGGHGGAIYTIAENTTVFNSNFTLNKAHYGGAIFVGGAGGSTNITDSNFTENQAIEDGGAIYLRSSNAIINRTAFSKNTARNGGALYAGGTGEVNQVYLSSFDNNRAEEGFGGAINWVAAAGHIYYTNFTNNYAKYGGGIHFNGNSNGSKVIHVRFENNTATENGGAMESNASSVELSYTDFISNYAKYGAALCREEGATNGSGHDNKFDSNHAYISGAALAWMNVSNIKIVNYTFINNTADGSGGAIYVSDGSDNCKVYDCYFEENFVTNAINGRGGAIDWIGGNGEVKNTTFISCVAVEGGAIYVADTSNNMTIYNTSFTDCRATHGDGGALELHGDDVTINLTNFTSCYSLKSGGAIAPINSDNLTIISSRFISCVSLDFGGAIAGLRSNNANITDCYFRYNQAAGHTTPEGTHYGEGGAISWSDSTNLNVYDSDFYQNNAFLSGGVISANNCNDSVIYNIKTYNNTASYNGGSISWINSKNVRIEHSLFNDSGAHYNGGSLYLNNVHNIIIKDCILNSTWASWGYGGGLYIGGNVTINNMTLRDGHDRYDVSNGIYFEYGNSSVINSRFIDTVNVIYIARNIANNVSLTNTNITGPNPNRKTNFIKIDPKYYDYSIWNEGNLSLKDNTFDYIIFNNGTICTETTTWILDNITRNETWNTSFTFFANITDDNNNTIISVQSLDTWNDVFPDDPHYPMPYNALVNTTLKYQGNFTIFGEDLGLKKNDVKYGGVNVRLPTELTITNSSLYNEDINFTVKISVDVPSNYTFNKTLLTIKINNDTIPEANITFDIVGDKWLTVYANFTKHHLPVGTYTISANYTGDIFHEPVQNEITFSLFSRDMNISISADDIHYGDPIVININSTAYNTVNGRILISIDGRTMSSSLQLNPDGTYTYIIPNENYTAVVEPGSHVLSVIFENGTYYGVKTNMSMFNVYKLSTSLDVNYTNITFGEDELINVTVNENAIGYIAVHIGNQIYVGIIDRGIARFNITGLATGPHNATITFPGDNHFNATAKNITFNVNTTKEYTFDVKVNDIEYKQNATVRVLVPTNAKGNVTIYVDGIDMETKNVTNGTAEFNIPNLAGGQHVVNATYNGDLKYASKDKNNTTFMVKSTGWKVDMTDYDYRPYGEITTINVTDIPKNIEGDYLTIKIDGIPYNVDINKTSGKATLRLDNLSAGSHTGYVIYGGDANYTNISQKFFPNIPQATPSISVEEVNGDVVATLSGEGVTPTGKVTFYVPGGEYNITLDNGQATLTKDKLKMGVNGVIAIYNGDNNYSSVRGKLMVNISKLNSTLDVIATGNTVGSNATVKVQAQSNATGNVIVEVNNVYYNVKLNSTGGGLLQIAGLGNGTYHVYAMYLGDDEYASSENTTETFEITKLDTIMGISVADSYYYGEYANITVTITPEATGYITIRINNTRSVTLPIVEGKVNWIVDGLAADKYIIYANYSGNSIYNVNNSNKVNKTFEVKQVTPTITIEVGDIKIDETTTVTIHINSTATGNLTGTIDGVAFNEKINGGKVEITTAKLTNKTYNIAVNYIGDKNYTAVTASSSFDVAKISDYELNITTVDVKAGEETTIVVTVPDDATGIVYINVNNTKKNATVDQGKAEFHITKEVAGRYVVNATLVDDKYANKTVIGNYYVDYADPSISVVSVSEPVSVGGSATVVVSVPDDISDVVTVEIDGKFYDNGVKSGDTVTFTVSDLTYGNKTVVARYGGDDKYRSGSATKNFTVDKVASFVNVNATDGVVDGSVVINVSVPVGATGLVVVNVNGTNYTINLTSSDRVVVDVVKDGLYNVTVTYVGDDKFLSSSNNTTFTVSKLDTVVPVISVNDTGYDDAVDVVVSVPVGVDGSITIKLNDTVLGTYGIVDGRVNITVDNPGAGEYTVYATYNGNYKYGGADAVPVGFTVWKATPVMSVDKVVVDANTSAVIVVRVNDSATGKVIVNVDGVDYPAVDVVGGVANCTIDVLLVDVYNVTVTYVSVTGDNFNDSSETFVKALNVTKVAVYPMDVSAGDVAVGENTTIVVSVPVDATGTVTVWVNGTDMSKVVPNDGSGKVEFSLNKTVEGRYDVNATLIDAKYGDQTVYGNYYVYKVDTPLSIDVSEPVSVGGSATVTVTVPEDIKNIVTIEIDGKTYYNKSATQGTVVFEVNNLTAGNQTVVATYGGDNKYIFNSTAKKFTVDKVDSFINVDATDKNVGDAVRVSVTSISQDATGYVVVEIKGVANYTIDLTSGPRYVDIKGLSAGTYHVNATYVGDDYYLSSYDDTESFTVSKIVTDINVTVEVPVYYGNDAVFTVELNVTINSTAKLIVDGKEYDVALVEGKCVFNVSGLGSGDHTVDVVFAGDDMYNRSTNSTTFAIDNANLVAKVNALNVTVEQNTAFAINVTDDFKGNVSIKVGDEVLYNGTVKTLVDAAKLPADNYVATVVFYGDSNYNEFTLDNVKFTVSKVTTTINVTINDVYYPAKAVANITIGNMANGTVNVTVMDKSSGKGKVFNGTVSNGHAIVNITGLSAGFKEAKVEFFSSDDYNNNANISTNFIIYPNNSNIVISDVNSSYKVGEEITFTVKTYNSTGDFYVYVNGKQEGRPHEYEPDRTYEIILSGRGEGSYVIDIRLDKDENFTACDTQTTVYVVKHDLTIRVNDTTESLVVGSPVNFTAVLNETVTGDVIFNINGINYTAHVDNSNNATYEYTPVNNATLTVVATFVANDKYNSIVSQPKTFDVNMLDSSVGIVAEGVVYGNDVNVVVTVDDGVEGSITIKLGDKTIGTYAILDGKVEVTLSGLAADDYIVYATYNGNDKYNDKTESKDFTVSKATPKITIDEAFTDANTSAKVIVHVNDAATGTITINVNDKPYTESINDGVAEFIVDVLPVGDYNITASYAPGSDKNYSAVSNVLKENGLHVAKVLVYPMNVTAADVGVGENTTITVSVPKDATGTVTIVVNGTSMSKTVPANSGKVEFTLNKTSEGRYSITATLTDDKYVDQTVYGNYYVYKVDAPISIVDAVYEDGVSTIVVSVPDDIKDITVEINGKLYDNGVKSGSTVTFTITDLVPGNKTVVATYNGDNKYKFNSTTKNFTVGKFDSFIRVNATDGVVDGEVVINVTVPVGATGYVVVNVNGTNYTINLTDGQDSVAVKVVKDGLYNVTVTYVGDDQFLSSSNKTNFTVSKLDTGVVIDVNDTVYDNKVNVVVSVDTGVEGSITIKLNDTDLGTWGIVDGKVNITIDNPGAGQYIVYAEYNGNYKYNENKTESKGFTVGRATPVITIDNAISDASNNATIIVHIDGDATGTMNITVNKKNYTANINNGVARFTVDVLPAGEYNITANYYALTDTNYTAANATLENGLSVIQVGSLMNVSAVDVAVEANTTIVVNVPVDATGTVTISVNGTSMSKVASPGAGQVVFSLNKTVAGKYTVDATLSDVKYGDITACTDYYVYKLDTPISIVDAVYDDGVATINVTVPDDIKDIVTVEINGKLYDNGVKSGSAVTFTITDLVPGNKTVVATYNGDNKYRFNSTTKNFTVDKSASSIKVDATDGVVDGEVVINVTVPVGATGYVVVNVNGTNYTINLTDGQDSVAVKVVKDGIYDVVATYIGDDQFLPSSDKTNFTVSKLDTGVVIDVNDTVYDNKLNVVVSVDSGVEGSITIKLNDSDLGTWGIVDSKVNITVDNPGAGQYTVYAIYNGNYKYNINDTESKDFAVDRKTPVITIDEAVSDASNNATIIVHIDGDATGTMNITVNKKNYTANINNGVARFTVDVLPVGEYNITANYYALTDTNYTAANATLENGLSVIQVGSLMNVSAVDVAVEANTTIVVNVPVDATGTVTISVNGTSMSKVVNKGEGQVVFSLNKTTAGKYVVNATLSDARYGDITAFADYYVYKLDAPISIVDAVYEDGVSTIVVSVPDDIKEIVTVEINGKLYDNGVKSGSAVTFTITDLVPGNKTVVATYNGDNKYKFNSTTKNYTVGKSDSFIRVDATDGVVDGDVIINVTVPVDATGYVVVNVNGTNYTINLTDGGKGEVAVKVVKDGIYDVVATYIGDDQFLANSNKTSFTVSKLDTVVPLIDVNDTVYDNRVNVVVSVDDGVEGTITIKFNGTEIGTYGIVDGKVDITVDNPGAGKYAVHATYNGNYKYESVDADPKDLNIDKAGSSVVIDDIAPVNYGDNVTVSFTVTNATTITYVVTKDGSVVIVNTTVDSDDDLILSDLGAGNYTITIANAESDNYTGNSASADFTVNKINVTLSAVYTNGYIIATLTNNLTGQPVKLANVFIRIDDELYSGQTNHRGQIKVSTMDLAFKNYTALVYYNGNPKYNPANTTVEFEARANTSLSVAYSNGELVATLINEITGKPIKGANVFVEINGTSYNNKTDSKGQIKVSTADLPLGNYTVIAYYNGNTKYNPSNASMDIFVKLNTYFVVADVSVGYNCDVELVASLINYAACKPISDANIVFSINGENYTAKTNSYGQAKEIVSGLASGTYVAVVSYNGSDEFNPASATFNVVVNKLSTSISAVYNKETNELVATLINAETGKVLTSANVVIALNGVDTHLKTDRNGQVKLALGDVDPNNYTAVVTYSGSGKYFKSTTTINAVENKITTSLSTVYDNETGEIVATLTNSETGKVVTSANVVFNLNGVKTAVKTDRNGQSRISTESLDSGLCTIGTSYAGNTKYVGSTTTINIFKI